MGRLIYSAITSLDGFVNDANGSFEWAAPSDEVHAFVNDMEREVGTYLYGRRMYDVMASWEDDPELIQGHAVTRDYAAIWKAAEKVVYSTTLPGIRTPRTRMERTFDPAAVREMTTSSSRDISIGGPTLAAHAISAGVVDEIRLFFNPIVVGGGTPALPRDVTIRLELLDERRFGNGVVYLRYSAG